MKKNNIIGTGFLTVAFQALLLLLCVNVWPQEPMIVPRLSGELIFDGIPDEEAWETITALPLVMHTPVYGSEPTELSMIKIAYNNDFLYVSGMFNYKNPEDIRAFSKKRDYATGKCDWLGVIIDTFNDRQNAAMFWTNPNGLRSEGTLQKTLEFSEPKEVFSTRTLMLAEWLQADSE